VRCTKVINESVNGDVLPTWWFDEFCVTVGAHQIFSLLKGQVGRSNGSTKEFVSFELSTRPLPNFMGTLVLNSKETSSFV
jgi:hypothetical protein